YDFARFQLSSVTSVLHADRHSIFRLPRLQSTIQGNVEDAAVGPLADLLGPEEATELVFRIAEIRQEPFDDKTKDDGLSQELRAVSTGDERLDWAAGLYYQQREQTYDQTAYAFASPTPGENRNLHRDGEQTMR